MNDQSYEAKQNGGPTGPCTAEGKARSRQNATKCGVHARHVLPGEEKEARTLLAAYKRELNPRTVIESEIIVELVINRLAKRRLRKYQRHEFEKAHAAAILEQIRKREQRKTEPLVRTIKLESGSQLADCMHPENCIASLRMLRKNVEDRGPDREIDLSSIRFTYGEKLSPAAAKLVALFENTNSAQALRERGDQEQAIPDSPKLKEEILSTIDLEIRYQEALLQLEEKIEQLEAESGDCVLPPELVLDRILKYDAALDRQFDRLLKRLENLRRSRN